MERRRKAARTRGHSKRTVRPAVRLRLPVRITVAEAKHIVAYYQKAESTLHIFNPKSLARGIAKGAYRLKWKPGASKATLTLAEIRTGAKGRERTTPTRVVADVVYAESPGGLVGIDAKLGDTRLVENTKKHDVAEEIMSCSPVGRRGVRRSYTYLGGNGDQSGAETVIVDWRIYNYDVTDCSRGYSGYDDQGSTWALSWQAWPNP
mgnify:CR=1 FL=1